MIRIILLVVCQMGLLGVFGATSYAQLSEQCLALQNCVDIAIPDVLASCSEAHVSCDLESEFKRYPTTQRFAASAGEIANRLINSSNCSRATTQSDCNKCYQRAKRPLKTRYLGMIFRGLLLEAGNLIETERLSVCGALP